MFFKKLKKLFPRHRAHPRQAGFGRRGLAFLVDALIIALISSVVYSAYGEIRAWINREPSPTAEIAEKIKKGGSLTLDFNEGPRVDQSKNEPERKLEYLKVLKEKLSPEQYEKAQRLSEEEIVKNYWWQLQADFPEIQKEILSQKAKTSATKKEEDRAYKIIKEYIITLLYFVLFFRLKGQTPGKKLFRLKVIDLEGKPRLDWYQCFERAHGYVCSGLFLSLGFWQVLWHKQGLTMHDKIADTTVIKLPPRPKTTRTKKTRETRSVERTS